jgi:uncharacterized protein YggT (Ycf19 family)
VSALFQILALAIYALITLVVVEVIFTNLMAFRGGRSSFHPIVLTVRRIVDPMLDPIRRILPPSKTGNLDFSPMILIVLLSLVRALLLKSH